MKVLSDKKKGVAARMTRFDNGWTVETWWNRSARSWVIQVMDENRNQLATHNLELGGDTQYVGTPKGAKLTHAGAIELIIKEGREPSVESNDGKNDSPWRLRMRLGGDNAAGSDVPE